MPHCFYSFFGNPSIVDLRPSDKSVAEIVDKLFIPLKMVWHKQTCSTLDWKKKMK